MEKERLIFCIQRFDHYYDSVNNKSAVFLALGTFIVGGLVTSYPFLKKNVVCTFSVDLFLILSVILGLSAIIIVIIATTPYLSKGESSLYYFNSIADKEEKIFSSESENFSREDEISDLRIQVHKLALGLRKKFIRLRIAGILYTLMFFAMIPLVALIIINLK